MSDEGRKELSIRYETELANQEIGSLIVKMVDGEDGAEKSVDYYLGAERSLLKIMSLCSRTKKDPQQESIVASMLSYVEHRIVVLQGEN